MDTPNQKARSLDRLPPHSVEAEQAVLSCVLLDPNICLPECIAACGKAGHEVFYDLRHQEIFSALCEMFNGLLPIDIITLQQRLKDRKRLEQVGGIAYLMALQETVPSAANLSYYMGIAHDKFLLRKMIHACTHCIASIYNYEGEVGELMDQVEQDVLSVRNFENHDSSRTIAELVASALNDFETAAQAQEVVDGLPTGLAELDSLSGGIHPGEMIVVAGFTSQGKSSLAMNIAENVVLVAKEPVGVFSLEMTSEELVKRYICSHARVNLRTVRQGKLSDTDYPKIVRAAGAISNCAIHFDDTSGLSITELRARARRMKQKHGIKVLIIDYLQLLSGDGRRYEKKQEELEVVSRTIKQMAKELRVAVIAVSQLNDQGKLFGSRTIGFDGDSVWKLERQKKAASGEADPDHVEVVLRVLKNRNGPTGPVPLLFIRSLTRFETAARPSESQAAEQQSIPYPND